MGLGWRDLCSHMCIAVVMVSWTRGSHPLLCWEIERPFTRMRADALTLIETAALRGERHSLGSIG